MQAKMSEVAKDARQTTKTASTKTIEGKDGYFLELPRPTP